MQGLIVFLLHCLQFQLLVVPLLFSNRICPLPYLIIDPLSTLPLLSSSLVIVTVGLLCP